MSGKKHDHKKQSIRQDSTAMDDQGTAGLQAEASAWKDKYLRALADYQNLEKRTQDAFDERQQRAGETIIKKLLPVADTLEAAERSIQDIGLSLALKELRTVLGDLGLQRLTTVGKEFNPADMECIQVVAGEANVVIEEVTPGYQLNGRLLRPAKVKVGGGEKTK